MCVTHLAAPLLKFAHGQTPSPRRCQQQKFPLWTTPPDSCRADHPSNWAGPPAPRPRATHVPPTVCLIPTIGTGPSALST